jgi:hypothetical protein
MLLQVETRTKTLKYVRLIRWAFANYFISFRFGIVLYLPPLLVASINLILKRQHASHQALLINKLICSIPSQTTYWCCHHDDPSILPPGCQCRSMIMRVGYLELGAVVASHGIELAHSHCRSIRQFGAEHMLACFVLQFCIWAAQQCQSISVQGSIS